MYNPRRAPSRLSLCPSEGLHGPYATLSHVWGHVQIMTTTLATIEDRMRAISLDDLSRTFRDAVVLARKMAIRYLWIDSLCIVQDCVDDWRSESSKMGRYYSNALLNIAAVSSPDGNGGCFMDRGLLPLTPCPVSIICADKTGSNTQTNCFILPRSEATWIVDPARKYYGGSTDRPPLWQRAWVLQERLLSPRTIQFSSLQMSWRCRMKEASESDPEMREIRNRAHMERSLWETLFGLKKFDAKFKTRVPSSDATDFQIEFGTQKELYALYDAWYELVTTYSSCFLTKPSDVFPAISGIAQMIALSINDRYLSGLWIQDLHRGLLWSVPHHSISRQDLREIRAPS
jgi:hypothetical protein